MPFLPFFLDFWASNRSIVVHHFIVGIEHIWIGGCKIVASSEMTKVGSRDVWNFSQPMRKHFTWTLIEYSYLFLSDSCWYLRSFCISWIQICFSKLGMQTCCSPALFSQLQMKVSVNLRFSIINFVFLLWCLPSSCNLFWLYIWKSTLFLHNRL